MKDVPSCSKPGADEPDVRIEKHPPERRQSKVVTAHCGCCCCCCCCLHSVGGLLGAALGSAPVHGKQEAYVEDEDNPGEYRRVELPTPVASTGTVGTYWAVLGVLSLLAVIVGIPLAGGRSGDMGLIILIIYFPGVQIAASVVTLFIVALSSGNQTAYLQLGKITLGTVLGTAIGVAAMYLTCMGGNFKVF